MGDLLLKLFNNILQHEHFPNQWSKGFIIPIFKSGDIDDPNNYRGITISNCLGKLFTKLLNTRLTNYLIDNRIISSCQIGFLPKQRTADHILLLKTIIDSFKKAKKKLFICFVDFKKAFDTVHRTGLIYKLLKLQISTKIINIIASMYENTNASVKTLKGLTKKFPI